MIHDFYLGAVGTIFLLNAIQWNFSRDGMHGLFTMQPLIWLLLALCQSLPLDKPFMLVLHAGGDGLILMIYLEMTRRLFGGLPEQRGFGRVIQWSIAAYAFIEAGLLMTLPDQWLSGPVYPYASLVYWSTLTVCCVVGMSRAIRHGTAVGWFFAIGSCLLMLNEAQSVYYFFTILFTSGPVRLDGPTMSVIQQVTVGGFIIKLLCFSLCLVYWQRKTAVARAVALTRAEEQLVQERLEARLTRHRLEQEKAQVQLRALQAQVNPHFLFNSLNSLSALIDEDPRRAGEFVNELSVVYRYLLRVGQLTNTPGQDGDYPLTTLASELAFIESYYHLLQTRYGAGLRLNVSVGAQYQHQLLPPLTLQLLVENAVKHNLTSPKHPLIIDIFVDAGTLTVRNNLQRKRSRVVSNGVGLATIATQYSNLRQPAPRISDKNDQFTVWLPLIAPSPARPIPAPPTG